jgi:hypothetical protein
VVFHTTFSGKQEIWQRLKFQTRKSFKLLSVSERIKCLSNRTLKNWNIINNLNLFQLKLILTDLIRLKCAESKFTKKHNYRMNIQGDSTKITHLAIVSTNNFFMFGFLPNKLDSKSIKL